MKEKTNRFLKQEYAFHLLISVAVSLLILLEADWHYGLKALFLVIVLYPAFQLTSRAINKRGRLDASPSDKREPTVH